jgi:hypothetical protein
MIDIDYQPSPMELGETRVLRVVSGHAPYKVSVSSFVSSPQCLGVRPWEAMPERSISEGESFEIKADERFWASKKGGFQIEIADASHQRRLVHINVRPRESAHSFRLVSTVFSPP